MVTAGRPIHSGSTLRRASRWCRDMALTGARYTTQRVPTYRRDREGSPEPPPDFDRELVGDPDTLQRPADGIGPLYHRAYWVVVTDETRGAEALIDYILEEPNKVAPAEMATFETVDGASARDVQVGDELVVRLPGPWSGPVRVIDRTPTSFRLATLQGHMEAGEIQFRTSVDARGFVEFRIESWARSGDPLFHLLYGRFVVGREMQQHMWAQFCRRVAAASGGVPMSSTASTTRQFDLDP